MSGDLKGYPMQGVHTLYGVDRDMDIVERLRLGGPNAAEVTDQAADEIERLRRKCEELVSYLNGISRQTAEMVKANRE